MDIKKVAILGGGTAGWLAANHIGKELLKRKGVSVTLIESPDIPPIGVGEGTVPDIRNTLKSFGIREDEFIRQCDATFKQSIKFVNWMDKKKHGEGNFFHHLFDVPSPYDTKHLTQYWLNDKQTTKSHAQFLSSQHAICEAGLAPKNITNAQYEGELAYAYHFNAGKFAQLLACNAKDKFSVSHVHTNVTQVKLANDGTIAALMTNSEGELEFDFYIDCSGFESLLIDKALKVPFVDVSDSLLINSALVVQVPTKEDEDIPPYTLATAHQAGWIWDIALTNRRGVGFVYSNNHMTDEQAHEKLDRYLGASKQDLSYRKIPMRVGYRKKFWHKNCVALGLAQGFLEPLEATSILLTDFSAKFLTLRFPSSTKQLEQLETRFNHAMGYAWERAIDFIKLHYCISDRTDSAFWVANKNDDTTSESLKEKLSLWEEFIPVRDDFFSQFEVFYLENFLFVLYGMNYNTKASACSKAEHEHCLVRLQQRAEIDQYLLNKLPNHRALLDKIKQYGLQTI
ncbi:tryptophan halogenase family protein [Pseudoalteromonas sp. meg-B1]|uniref:tryptophan halogenase family protein n=1 Tax=Pseudoalteromonas sp. meg-B1 TaxID=2203192 RepID=UPI000D6F3655|nr:tryptophan halogenase family protein [Pseudoalteromonas sp. meg-B1]PWS56049.1 tryptophan 7-halogenase [Pseudoalteromonas sp. meg-B1]